METTQGESVTAVKANAMQLAKDLCLDEANTSILVRELMEQSKRSFMAGNRSGIRWARLNPTNR